MSRIAENTVIVDGQEYKPGDVIPDFKSIKCVDTREPRKYQGLSADVSVLNDVIAKYASGGASCFMSDTGEYYEYDREEKTFKLITNITERGFDSEKAYGALKHMLKNVTVSDEKIQSAVTNYLTVNPVLPGATTEQAQQIDQNKTNIESLKTSLSDVEKNVKNQSRSITNIQSAIKELNKKMSIDTYDELAEALVTGKIEGYVNAGDELMVNQIKTLSITSNNGNLSFEVSDEQKFIRKVGRIDEDTYVLEYRGSSWMYLEEAINTSDFGFAVNGIPFETDLIYVKMNYEQVSYTFVDFDPTGENVTHPKDPDVKHFAVVEQTYVLDAFNYDYPESALCITPGYTLSKGKYYIYNTANATSDWWCNYKRLYYAFEILNDIVATEETGDIQLQFYSRGDRETTGDARGIYELTCKPYCCATKAFYNSDTVKFVGQVAHPGEEYIDIRTIENFTVNQSMDSVGIIYNNLGHVCYGNNEWNVSNLRQRMNSNEKSMNPVRTHENDVLNGMYNVKGSMWGLDPRFTNLIKPCIVSLEHGMNDEFTRYQLYTCEDVATLLSMKEMSFNMQTDEGQITKLYGTYTNNQLTNDAIASRAKARQAGGTPQDYRWSRSATADTSHNARLVAPSGAYDGSVANSGYRFAPAYIIGVADHRESTKSAEA